MKKIYIFSILIIVCLAFTSCQNTEEITDTTSIEIYKDAKNKLESATSMETTSYSDIVTTTNGEEVPTPTTTTYSYNKKGEDYEANARVKSDTEELELTLYFKDDILYANRSDSEDKFKTQVDYQGFSSAYNPFTLIDFEEADVLQRSIKKEGNDTIVTQVLDPSKMDEVFDKEMTTIEVMTEIKREYLYPQFSNVTYVVTFDKNNEIKNVLMEYEIDMTLKLSELLSEVVEPTEDLSLEDQHVKRKISINTSVNKVNDVEINFPDDLESYKQI